MGTLAGGDYYQVSRQHVLPTGLVSDPPNYARCVARLEAAAANSSAKTAGVTGVQLLTTCRELYQALREQAVSYLVAAQWAMALYRDLGLSVSDAEVATLFAQVRAREFPTEADERTYLANRGLDLADEMLVVKLDALAQKGETLLQSGGKQGLKKLTEAGAKWTAKTTCRAGYVVAHCSEYAGEKASSIPSPAVLLERVAFLATGVCTDQTACGKQ